MKLGLLTGGGDCPGLNAAIRAVVKHAIGGHGMEVIGIREGLTGLMEDPPAIRPLSLRDVHGIHALGGTILGTNNRGSPFRKPDEAAKALADARRGWKILGLDALIVIGGDGTQFMARRLSEDGLKLVGIPKTIDNDLVGTDMTIGFQTAVEVAAEAAARLATSADSHDRIMVLEVMGRDAGHIALMAAIAAGANAALLPEIPFSYDLLADRIRARQALGRSSFLLVVAEGAAPIGGSTTYRAAPSGTMVVGGMGVEVARELHQRTGIDARATILGHLQRGGAPSAPDRILAAMMGKRAVDLVAAGRFGRVVGVSKGELIDFPYSDVEDARRLVDLKSEDVSAAEALGISLGRKSSYKAAL